MSNQITSTQKTAMAEFMEQHPRLAMNLIETSDEGKATADSLWQNLTNILNRLGPPYKHSKLWKQVYAHQKYQAKKKFSFNKHLREPNDERKQISVADKIILKASGLEVEPVSENKNKKAGTQSSRVKAASQPSPVTRSESDTKSIEIKSERNDSVESLESVVISDPLDTYVELSDDGGVGGGEDCEQDKTEDTNSIQFQGSSSQFEVRPEECVNESDNAKRKCSQDNSGEGSHHANSNGCKKQKLDHSNDTSVTPNQMEFQQRIEAKLDRLLDIQERILKLKEEKHKSDLALNLMKMRLKKLQFEKLKGSQS